MDLFDGFLKSPIHIFMLESSLSSSFEQINLGKRCDLPGPLGLLLGALEGSLTASWGALRALGAILGPLGRVLGPLGAVLGPLGAVSWGYVGAT